jgi:hypothetical protein
MLIKIWKKNKILLSATLLVIAIILGSIFLLKNFSIKFNVSPRTKAQESFTSTTQFSQIDPKDIPASNLNFEDVKKYLESLANKKGARYAFAIMKQMQPGPNIDMHLLGHAVGDILYKQEGSNGITDCDNDFRNACSHTIVIGLFYDKGDGALSEIAAACRKAPGGSGAYTMCFHGLGHGVLSYEGYDMAKAAAMCQKTGTKEYNYQEGSQCIGGMIMEIVDGGGHNHDLWAKERVKYLDPKHPTALCENSYFPESSKFFCYEYITPYLFEAAGAQPGNPTASDFKKAFNFCKQVVNISSRNTCYGGFGKEFVGIQQSRDIRIASIAKISNESLKQVYDWCLLAADKNGSAACIVDSANNLYWGGENDFHISLRLCAQVSDEYNRKSCYYSLIQSANYYSKDQGYKEEFCSALPQNYTEDCKKRLGL